MNKKFSLSKSEYEIMSLLWREKRSLSKTEIIEMSDNKSWKPSSIYILLNSLLKKGVISEDGYVKSKTNIGRTFSPTLSENDYLIMQINMNREKRNLSLPELLVGLIDEENDFDVIEELEKIIKNKLEELNEVEDN